MGAPGASPTTLTLDRPLVIYSRKELNAMLLKRAEDAGAQLEKTRVTGVSREGDRWRIATREGEFEADHCVIAMGARNALRGCGTQLGTDDSMSALGYYVQGEQAGIDIQFSCRACRLYLGVSAVWAHIGGNLRQRRTGCGVAEAA